MTGHVPRILRRVADPALASAWRGLLRLWRPMAIWSLLVWASVAVILAPSSSALLGGTWLLGSETVVANQALLGWFFTLRGLAWLVLAGTAALVGTVLHFAGIFEIVTEDVEGVEASVPETALRLGPEVPSLVRLCAATVLAALALALPVVGGVAGIHRLLLGARDINYYLAVQPAVWWYAVAAAGAWTAAWGALGAWLAGRSVLALPAYLDGHRPLSAALRRSWRTTRGEGGRIVLVLAVAAGGWLGGRALLNALMVGAGSALVGWTASASHTLRPVLTVTGGWTLLSLALDALVGFVGLAYLSTLLTGLYHEDTALHAEVEARGTAETSGDDRDRVVRWLRPARVLPALGTALVASALTGGILLEGLPEPRPVEVVAHRGGPPPSPENTLAALERSVTAGADWAEIDVQLSRDAVPVVVHDADLMRVAGTPLRVARTDFAKLSDLVKRPDDGTAPEERRVASLGDFLDRARGRIGLVIELKYYGWDPRLAPEVVGTLAERPPDSRAMIMSLDLRAIRQLRDLEPGLPVGYAAAAAVGDLTRLPVDVLALSRSASRPSLIRAAHRRGMEVYVWTVNSAMAMAEVVQDGADGLVTDRPALAARVHREMADLPAVSRLLLRFGHLLTEPWEEASSPDEL